LETELRKLQAVEKLCDKFETQAKEAHLLLKRLEIEAQVKPTWTSLDF